jgi:hypothetical protein
MGLIGRLVGGPAAVGALGQAVTDVAGAFVPNATRRMELSAEAFEAVVTAQGEEFRAVRPGRFDRAVNGLNRLPRPMLALGTLGLFVYAMADPAGFAARMVGLGHVPEPLWWLLGAIVSFYFGAREMFYFRGPGGGRGAPMLPQAPGVPTVPDNPALAEWQAAQG